MLCSVIRCTRQHAGIRRSGLSYLNLAIFERIWICCSHSSGLRIWICCGHPSPSALPSHAAHAAFCILGVVPAPWRGFSLQIHRRPPRAPMLSIEGPHPRGCGVAVSSPGFMRSRCGFLFVLQYPDECIRGVRVLTPLEMAWTGMISFVFQSFP